MIRISAEYKSPWEENGEPQSEGRDANLTHHRQSRYSREGSFQFAYTFPQEVKPDAAQAHFENGRLELHLPKVQKAEDANRPRQIPINTGPTSETASPAIQMSASQQHTGGQSPPNLKAEQGGQAKTATKPADKSKKAA